MSYSIKQEFITGHNRPKEPLHPIGMVVHDTATPGATDERERDYFQDTTRNSSVHAFVDWDSITQTIPWDEVAWGSGYTSNHRFLQIELCVPSMHDVSKFNEVWRRGIWLFAWLYVNIIKIATITPQNLMSHAEVSEKWHETNHTDPIAYFAEYGKTVDQFRAEVQQEINSMMGGNEVDSLIIAYYDGDVPTATIAMFKFQCAMILREVFENNKAGNKAKTYYVIGGPESYDPGVLGATVYHLSGSDRVKTALKALS